MVTNDYILLFVAPNFLNGAAVNSVAVPGTDLSQPGVTLDLHKVQKEVTGWERLDLDDCIDAYSTNFITDRRTLVIVTRNESGPAGSVLLAADDEFSLLDATANAPGALYDPYTWYIPPLARSDVDVEY